MKNSCKKGKKYSVNFVSEARAASSVVHRVRDLTALATLPPIIDDFSLKGEIANHE